PSERNVISGNQSNGILIQGAGATGNIIQGNFIGTTALGTAPLGNLNGIDIQTPGNFVGGTDPNAGNVIGGNRNSGVAFETETASGNTVQGNRIGIGTDGETHIGNTRNGVDMFFDGGGNTIGGVATGAPNRIEFNGE